VPLDHDHFEENLLTVRQAKMRLLEQLSPVGIETVPLNQAAWRVLAAPVASTLDLPPFPNSSMDGFAVRSGNTTTASRDRPVRLEVVGDIPAGIAPKIQLQDGQAARIMTGAVVPAGADAVVPVENTDFHSRDAGLPAPDSVLIYSAAPRGANVRPMGQDVRLGEVVLAANHRLRPQDVGLLSMVGAAQVPVFRRPLVAVFSSGDELLPVEVPLSPGKIHDSNTYTLLSLVEEAGGLPLNLGIIRDTRQAVQACLDQAVMEKVDLIISSAGVSVGAFDFVRSVVERNGHLNFWRVNMRPGKPLAFGHYQGIPFIGLPGNPVSAFVGFEVFVRPAIARQSGERMVARVTQQVKLVEPVESDGRESYLRAILVRQSGELLARLTGHQGSGNLRSLVQANAFLIIPSGVKSLPAGSEATAWITGVVENIDLLDELDDE
jgi:molybdopterin molybdotransferase